MIDIISKKGEVYSYDPNTGRVFKDQMFIPRTEIEPVFSGSSDDDIPEFAGLYLKNRGAVLTKNGVEKKLTQIDAIK